LERPSRHREVWWHSRQGLLNRALVQLFPELRYARHIEMGMSSFFTNELIPFLGNDPTDTFSYGKVPDRKFDSKRAPAADGG
jgi:hypothetical protein